MKSINLKRYNDITYPSRISDNVKLVEHNQENIVIQFEALKTIEKLIKDQLDDLKQEILENKNLHKFFNISHIKGKHLSFYKKAHKRISLKKY